MSFGQLFRMYNFFDGGYNIEYVKNVIDKDMKYYIVGIMMWVDLDQFLKFGENVFFKIKWWYNVFFNGCGKVEYFVGDDNYIYIIVQFFLRMCVYNEVEGWQYKEFLGRGEFILVFGDYEVNIIVLVDYIIVVMGILQNFKDVLIKE